jgi:hypothetical protein
MIDRLLDVHQKPQALSLGQLLTNQVTCLRGCCRRVGACPFPVCVWRFAAREWSGKVEGGSFLPDHPRIATSKLQLPVAKTIPAKRFTTKPNVPSTLASPHKEIAYFRNPS